MATGDMILTIIEAVAILAIIAGFLFEDKLVNLEEMIAEKVRARAKKK